MINFFLWRVRAIFHFLFLLKRNKKKITFPESGNRILILFAGGIGDAINVEPIIAALREQEPDVHIDCVVETEAVDLIKRIWRPAIIIKVDRHATWFASIPIIRRIRKGNYDICLTTITTVYFVKFELIAWLSKAKFKTGPVYEEDKNSMYDYFVPVKQDLHDVEQNFRLLKHVFSFATGKHPLPSIKLGNNEITYGKRIVAALPNFNRYIAVHPGGDKHFLTKRWPVEYFPKLFEKCADSFFLVFLGADEEEFVETFQNLPRVKLFKGLELFQVAGLLKQCHLLIANDNGIAHLASAIGVQTVTIFGPSNPVRTAPYNQQGGVISKKLFCSPCIYESAQCKRVDAPLECMHSIRVEDVLEKINQAAIKSVW